MNPTLTKKLRKVLDLNSDEPEFQAALHGWATLHSEIPSSERPRAATDVPKAGSTSALTVARRNLRGDLENRSLLLSQEYLSAFESVQRHMDNVLHQVDEMKRCCENMAERLRHTSQATGQLVHQAGKLQEERRRLELQHDVAQRFLSRFQLSEDELQALRANVINEAFFKALDRVHQILQDCKKLLVRTQHQRLGLEIMDTMAEHQQTAFDTLYRWVQGVFRSFDDDIPEVPPLLRLAVRALQERAILLGYCLDELEASRGKALVRMFMAALTVGGPGGMPRPIELHAHDPVRYVGDMLAWLHQAAASELELVSSLFSGNLHSNSSELKPLLHKILAGSFEAVSRPVRARIEQVIHSKPGIVPLYRLANLLDFYTRTIRELVGDKSPLTGLFGQCKGLGLKAFYDQLKDYGDTLQASPPRPPADLSPPHAVHEAMSRLAEIMAIFEASLVPAGERSQEFAPVLSAVIDPLVRMCTLSATGLKPSDMAVFMLNCLSAIQGTLAGYSGFTAGRQERLSLDVEAHLATLVEEEARTLLQQCGLAGPLAALRAKPPHTPLARLPHTAPAALAAAMRAFEQSLFDLVLPQCDRLLHAALRAHARAAVSALLHDEYARLYAAVMDPANGYEDPLAICHYKPDQVRTMVEAL